MRIQRIAAIEEIRSALVGANGAETIRTNPGRRVSIYFDDAANGMALYEILTDAMQAIDPIDEKGNEND